MTHALIGYARCSTDKQDLAAQHDALLKLGVAADRIYTDKGVHRHEPGAACPRPGAGGSAQRRHTGCA